MENQVIPALSKNVKIINDINQVVKKSFLRYFITRNGVVFTDDKGAAIDNGTHFSYLDNIDKLKSLIDIPEGYLLMLDSAMVYTTIKDNKKAIRCIKIEDSNVYISGEDINFHIGKFVAINDTAKQTYETVVNRIMKKNESTLLDKDIEAMLRNEVVLFSEGDMKVRLTKTVIPHIKLGLPITLAFLELDDPNLFEIMISITKDDITNFHVYTCIRY